MKRLYRIEKNKVFGGVCGGLAEYFEVDPVLVRVLFIVLFFGWGISLLAYIILWIVSPKKSDLLSEKKVYSSDDSNRPESFETEINGNNNKALKNHRILGGLILITIGTLWFLENIFDYFDFSVYFPVILILIGIFILLSNKYSGRSTKPLNNIEN